MQQCKCCIAAAGQDAGARGGPLAGAAAHLQPGVHRLRWGASPTATGAAAEPHHGICVVFLYDYAITAACFLVVCAGFMSWGHQRIRHEAATCSVCSTPAAACHGPLDVGRPICREQPGRVRGTRGLRERHAAGEVRQFRRLLRLKACASFEAAQLAVHLARDDEPHNSAVAPIT
jgi:hypothetical protein